MTADALRFDGEVLDASGTVLGEARFWGSAERDGGQSSWRGWLRVTDLGRNDLPAGRYRARAVAGWEAKFEPIVTRAERVFEIDLLPIQGIGPAPWPDVSEEPGPVHRPLWDDTPPRSPHDRTRFPDLAPLGLYPREGVLPPELEWPAVPEERT